MDKKGGKSVKLLLDEWGYPYGGFPSGGVPKAAPLLARTWLLCLAFDLKCDLGIFFDWEGTVDTKTLVPNELFRAARSFQHHIGTADRFDKLAPITSTADSKADQFAAKFIKDGAKVVFAVWQSKGDDAADLAESHSSTVRIGTGQKNVCWRVFNHLGAERKSKVCSDTKGEAELEGVTGSPVYLA